MDTEKARTNPSSDKLFLLWDSVKRITSDPDTKQSTFEEEHESRVRRHYSQLLNSLRASDVVALMFQSEKLTAKEHEYIRQFQSTPIRESEELLNIILRNSRDVYDCFLETLKKTKQHHLYQMLTSEDESISLDKQSVSEHSRLIRKNYVYLVESMDPDSGLLASLFASKVLSCREYEHIGSQKNQTAKNETLLSIISRKSADDFKKFRIALKDTLQESIINRLVDSPVGGATENLIAKVTKTFPDECNRSLEKEISPKPLAKPIKHRHILSFSRKPMAVCPRPLPKPRLDPRVPVGIDKQLLSAKHEIVKRRSVASLESKFRTLQNELQTIMSTKMIVIPKRASKDSIWKICYQKIIQESQNLSRQNMIQAKATGEQRESLMQEIAFRESENKRITDDIHREKIRTKGQLRELHETQHDLEERLNHALKENKKLCGKLEIAEAKIASLVIVNRQIEQNDYDVKLVALNHKLEEQRQLWAEEKEQLIKQAGELQQESLGVRENMEQMMKEKEQLFKQTEEQERIIEKLRERGKSYTYLVHTIRTKAGKEQIKDIFGMTILDKKLFIVSWESSEVEVYDTKDFGLSGQLNVKELNDPWDIGSCCRNKCLYIMDHIGPLNSGKILKVDLDGKVLKSWSTGDDYGDGLSVTYDLNVILTIFQKNKLNEYSPDGQLIRQIKLSSDSGICHPWHALKLTNGHYVVCHGYSDDDLHRVCIVDEEGRLKKCFGGNRGSTKGEMICPEYLVADENGFVMVADRGNSRVLVLHPDLEFNKKIIFRNLYELQSPLRILFDESTRRLFVVDNGNNRRILIFDLNY